MNRILVTGATGPLGASVTSTLLKHRDASAIRILARDAAKAAGFAAQGVQIAIGDYNHYPSLVAALKDIDHLFLVSGNDVEQRTSQHLNVIRAAQESKVKKIVYVSLQRVDETPQSPVADKTIAHLETEKAILASGITHTILKNALYAEMIPVFAGPQLQETKTIYLPAEDGKAAYALRADLGEAGANILLDETGRFNNRSIELTGPEAVSWQEIAAMMSEISGQQFHYVSPTAAAFIDTLTKAGAPAWLGPAMAGMQQAVARGEYSNVTPDLELILGRKPVTVYTYLQSFFGN